MAKVGIAGLVALACTGCALWSGRDDRVYSATYVGDRAWIPLEEIVAAVPSKDKAGSVANLHIVLAAIINPTRAAKRDVRRDIRDVESILVRLYPRIASAVVAAAQRRGPVAAGDLAILRELLATEANSVCAASYSRWAYADRYAVDLVVTSFYVTDGSVGRAAGRSRTWW